MTKRRRASLRGSRHCYVAVEPVACASVAAGRLLSSRLGGAATNWFAQRKVPPSSFKRCVTVAAHALQGRAGQTSEEVKCQAAVLIPGWRAAALVFLPHYLCLHCRVGSRKLERDRHLLESVAGRDGHASPGPGLQAADGRHRAPSPLPHITAHDPMALPPR